MRRRHGLPDNQAIGVGVDRFDYTKGIEERLRAVERLLERWPEWVGRFTFIQIAAPTRGGIEEYDHYQARVRALVDRINARFADASSHPAIILLSDAPRAGCRAPVLSRGRRVHGQQPARRHEPRGQGVRRVA